MSRNYKENNGFVSQNDENNNKIERNNSFVVNTIEANMFNPSRTFLWGRWVEMVIAAANEQCNSPKRISGKIVSKCMCK